MGEEVGVLLGPLDPKGEVVVRLEGPVSGMVRESRLPGLWHVRRGAGTEAVHEVVVAEVPNLLREAAAAEASSEIPIPVAEGSVHGRALLLRIAQCLKGLALEDTSTLFDLTHCPLSSDDHALIDRTLKTGTVWGWSLGYPACQAVTTSVRCIWRVRYRNGDKLVLDTIEIVDIPAVLRAQREDIDDSLTRFDTLLRE